MNSTKPLLSLFLIMVPHLACLLLVAPAASQEHQTQSLAIGERLSFYSDVLDEERTILVTLPQNYHVSNERYPVLYVLDGEFFLYQAYAAAQFLSECTYIRTHPISQMIVIGIVNVDRNRDYTPTHAPIQGELRYPTSGGATKFLEFLQSELIPTVDTLYRTQPYRILSGWSFGGLFTCYTYLEEPDLFSAYLAISPSLWWEQDRFVERLRNTLTDKSINHKPLVVTLGALEGSDMGRSVRNGLMPLVKSENRTTKEFSFIEIPGQGHYFAPYVAFYEGLPVLFKDWALPQERLEGGLGSIQSFYKELSMKTGYTVEIPESAYQALVGSLISKGNNPRALEIARLTVKKYPKSSWAHRTLGVMLMRTGDESSARNQFERAIAVEKELSQPDSERIMDARLQLWLLDQ